MLFSLKIAAVFPVAQTQRVPALLRLRMESFAVCFTSSNSEPFSAMSHAAVWQTDLE